MKTKDECFIDWESEFFGYGYGTGEEYTLKALKDFFNLFKEKDLENNETYKYEIIEKELGKSTTWFLINVLCRADIIEYGCSPRYGWLSEKGVLLANYINNKTFQELYDLCLDVDESYGHCGKNYCNCDGGDMNKKCKNNSLF